MMSMILRWSGHHRRWYQIRMLVAVLSVAVLLAGDLTAVALSAYAADTLLSQFDVSGTCNNLGPKTTYGFCVNGRPADLGRNHVSGSPATRLGPRSRVRGAFGSRLRGLPCRGLLLVR